MAAELPDRLAVQEYADHHYTPGHIPYISFAGLTEGILTDSAMTDAERVAEIRLAMAAMDLLLAEQDDAYQVIPGGPIQPPYGSDEPDLDDDERQAIDRAASLRTADTIARFLRGEL